jgi:hypothetical protein
MCTHVPENSCGNGGNFDSVTLLYRIPEKVIHTNTVSTSGIGTLHVNSPEFSEQNQEIIQIFFDVDDAMLLSSNRQEVNSVDLSISETANRFPWTCDPPLLSRFVTQSPGLCMDSEPDHSTVRAGMVFSSLPMLIIPTQKSSAPDRLSSEA